MFDRSIFNRDKQLRGVYFILVLYVVVFAFFEMSPFISGNIDKFTFSSVENIILNRQFYRLFVTIFAGVGDLSLSGILGLIVNSYVVYMVGSVAEMIYGEFKLLAIYIIPALFASFFALIQFSNPSFGFTLGVTAILGSIVSYTLVKRKGMDNSFYYMNMLFGFILIITDIISSGMGIVPHIVSFAAGCFMGFLICIFDKN